MFGTISSGLTLGKAISGITKSLAIINQVLPLYQQAKPMINNAKSILGVLKGLNQPSSSKTNNTNTIDQKKDTFVSKNVSTNTNLPVFFN